MKRDIIEIFTYYLNQDKTLKKTKNRLDFMQKINRFVMRFVQLQSLDNHEAETLKKYVRQQFISFMQDETKQSSDLWSDFQSYLPKTCQNMTLKKAYQSDNADAFKAFYLSQKDKISTSKLNRCLYQATKDNKYNIVKMLINEGADVNAVIRGKPLLLTAGSTGNAKMVYLYLDNGADATAGNFYIGCILHYICNTVEGARFPIEERIQLIDDLVRKYKVDVNSKTGENFFVDAETPLLVATEDLSGHIIEPAVIKKLVELGADVNYCANDSSPLSEVTRHFTDTTDIMRFLIDAGADVNFMSPLLWAIDKCSVEKTKLLLDAGAGYYKKPKSPCLEPKVYTNLKIMKDDDRFTYQDALNYINHCFKTTHYPPEKVSRLKTIKAMIHKKMTPRKVKKKETKKEFLQKTFNRQNA